MELVKWGVLFFIGIANGAECPIGCRCNSLETTCGNNELNQLPENIYLEVRVLDLSYNYFVSIPSNISVFEQLERLSLRHNRINALGINSLEGLKQLKELDLSENSFTQWSDIHSDVLVPAKLLRVLDLSYNQLKGFPELRSDSLVELRLTNCSIAVFNQNALINLPNVTHLQLGNNNLKIVTPLIKSEKLVSLNISTCSINEFHTNALLHMPALKYLYLSKNYALKSFNTKSESLEYLDVSDCNIESLPKNSLPNLTYIDIRSNHIRKIEAHSFVNMSNLRNAYFADNAISEIHKNAFSGLTKLYTLDLSFNTIRKIDSNMFYGTNQLQELHLSHNYISELPPLYAANLRYLDLSECEIYNVAASSLRKMPALSRLNLSKNIITNVPANFSSRSLEVLDVSYCRITALKNDTFRGLVKLRSLNLIGNRLIEIKFYYIKHLERVRLNDNAWRCDCTSDHFKELYSYLINIDSDVEALTCQSPEKLEGLIWYQACGNEWFNMGYRGEKAWVYSMVFVVVFSLGFCVVISFNRSWRKKRERNREAQRERDREQNRQILRRMRERAEGPVAAASTNAPDPRELERPPSYGEAMSMTQLTGSCGSLSSRKSTGSNNNVRKKPRTKRKRRKSKSAASDEQSTSRPQDSGENERPSSLVVYMESDI